MDIFRGYSNLMSSSIIIEESDLIFQSNFVYGIVSRFSTEEFM